MSLHDLNLRNSVAALGDEDTLDLQKSCAGEDARHSWDSVLKGRKTFSLIF